MSGQPGRKGRGLGRALIAVAAFGCATGHAQAVSHPPSKKGPDETPQARIAAVAGWRVLNDHALLIQGQGENWYKAVLMSSCYGLPTAQRVGFESNADGSFDRRSAIRVGAQSCPLASLTETVPPTPARKAPSAPRARAAPDAPAAPAAPNAPGSAP